MPVSHDADSLSWNALWSGPRSGCLPAGVRFRESDATYSLLHSATYSLSIHRLQVRMIPGAILDAARVRKPTSQLRKVLANNIRAHRAKLDISQEQLADACGLHRTYIGSVERCERNVTLSTLEVLAAALDVSVPELLTR
jgi:ribosome-binding protein aMBF1 (putative translation factor)